MKIRIWISLLSVLMMIIVISCGLNKVVKITNRNYHIKEYNVWENDTLSLSGQKLPCRKKFVQVKNGDIILTGAFYLPIDSTKEQFPVTVLCHGSGPRLHSDIRLYVYSSIKSGMGALALDKRGVGNSGGTYKNKFQRVENSEYWFDLLASDLVAGLHWVKEQLEADTNKTGLFGGSQAGWIMPLAASMDSGFRFVIIGEGCATSYGEEGYFSSFTKNGLPLPGRISIEEADKKMNDFDTDTKRYPYGMHGYQTMPVLEKLEVPILWFFGTNDPVIPVDLSLRNLEKLAKPNNEVVILPNGNHNFVNTETGKRYDLVSYIIPWLQKIGIL